MRAVSSLGCLALFALSMMQISANAGPEKRSSPNKRSLFCSINFKFVTKRFRAAFPGCPVQNPSEASPTNNEEDLLEKAIALGGLVEKYTENMLRSAATEYSNVVGKIEHFNETMADLVNGARKFRQDVQIAAKAHGLSVEEVSAKMSILFATILEEIKEEFPPPEGAPGHLERALLVSHVMTKVEDGMLALCGKYGMSEENLKEHLENTRRPVERLVVVVGDLIEEHPVLLETLLFSGAMLLIPEAWYLRPLLGLFGFGPGGPVKGSAAAWAQRRFWGAAVARGSWFALLQAVGMKSRL